MKLMKDAEGNALARVYRIGFIAFRIGYPVFRAFYDGPEFVKKKLNALKEWFIILSVAAAGAVALLLLLIAVSLYICGVSMANRFWYLWCMITGKEYKAIPAIDWILGEEAKEDYYC